MEIEPVKNLNELKAIYGDLISNNRLTCAEYVLIGCNLPLKPEDLTALHFNDLSTGKLHYDSKALGRIVTLDVNIRVKSAVERLRQFYISKGLEPSHLFRSTSARAYHLDQPITIQYFSSQLKASGERLKLEYRFTPKSLSKTFAYHAFVNGVDINQIQQLFGFGGRRNMLRLVGLEDYENRKKGTDDAVARARETAIHENKVARYDWCIPPLSDRWLTEGYEQEVENFSADRALKDLFIHSELKDKILNTLKSKKNIIIQGAPGVGKTFLAKKIAQALTLNSANNQIEMVQFHQTYSYEDFVEGFRPTSDGFALREGIFYRFCELAKSDPDYPYVFIIDEINRGNISKIFGELMMLIERDKRGKEWSVSLTYSGIERDKFYIPNNIHLIGLMNTADRSLSMIDYALRRRFSFINIDPMFDATGFSENLLSKGVSEDLIERIKNKMIHLNNRILDDAENLGRGFCIGHSYFCPNDKVKNEEDWFDDIISLEIIPLIEEYWFDDPDKVSTIRSELLS
tara:strand:- start:4868 stop:6415 length:1548 start_codon:yes stop_codon:yes gene_type:complete